MLAKPPDTLTRKIAVVLGIGGPGQPLLDILQPLLGQEIEVNLQGVFVEDEELQLAADLPFVKEVCRLTLSVREIHSARYKHTVALRTRSARSTIAGLAQRMGIAHTFNNVKGSTVRLLRETADSADITFFEPLRIFTGRPPLQTRQSRQRIVVAIDDLAAGSNALFAAALLASGDMQKVSVLLTAAALAELDAKECTIGDLLPADPADIRLLAEPLIQDLIASVRIQRADMLVLGATEELLKPESLRLLLAQLRCPVCLVRRWEGTPNDKPV